MTIGAPACVVSVDHEGTIEREERRFQVEKAVELHLITFDGAIEVRSWDKPEVLVQIEKRGQDKEATQKIEILSTENAKEGRIHIEARYSGRSSFVGIGVFHAPSARLIASVPRKTNLVIRTGDGRVIVERVDGKAEIRTADGDITATETSGELLAETGDGHIKIEEATGRLEARTNDGTIRLSGVPTVVRARTGDGPVYLRIRPGCVMAEDWMIATSDGHISIELPDGFNADIEADPSSDGRVKSELTLGSQSGGTREVRILKGTLGQGGRRLTIRTGDGTISLKSH